MLTQIDQFSNEVKETIYLAEAKLITVERQDQRTEREAAEKYRLSSMFHRKEREKAEADRAAQMQIEKRSESSKLKLMLLHGLIEHPQKFIKHPNLSNYPATITRLLTGKLVHNGTAPQVNGSPRLMTFNDGSLEVTPACSGLPAF